MRGWCRCPTHIAGDNVLRLLAAFDGDRRCRGGGHAEVVFCSSSCLRPGRYRRFGRSSLLPILCGWLCGCVSPFAVCWGYCFPECVHRGTESGIVVSAPSSDALRLASLAVPGAQGESLAGIFHMSGVRDSPIKMPASELPSQTSSSRIIVPSRDTSGLRFAPPGCQPYSSTTFRLRADDPLGCHARSLRTLSIRHDDNRQRFWTAGLSNCVAHASPS